MILHYNVHAVSDIIQYERHLIENSGFLEDTFLETFNTYQKFGLNNHNAIYDRSENIPHFLKISKNKHPIPVGDYTKSFFETSEQRAKELLALNVPINVMWSGGIDSTYIMFILKYFANDPDQIRVYGTYNSIIESGDMFSRKIQKEFNWFIKPAQINQLNYENEGIYVSGMCGNQLFGPTDDMFATGNTAMFHHTLGTPDTIYEPYESYVDEGLIEFLNPIIKSSPKKIETIADLRWLCIFNLDWYTAIYEHRILLPQEKYNRVYGFFDSENFQKWAINTKEPFTKIPGNPNTHRWQMREVLADLFGEREYAQNKSKKISNFSVSNHLWLFLLENGHNVLQ